MDCKVGSTSTKCPGTPGAGPGGYTYGDFGKVSGGPEVHADGEIWGQTLWDLRDALGQNLTEFLVTRAMELSPSNPSMLDERDSILLADATLRGGRQINTIWSVFAHRGMGFFAGALDGNDSTPGEDFSTPPPDNAPTGTPDRHSDRLAVRLAGRGRHDHGGSPGRRTGEQPERYDRRGRHLHDPEPRCGHLPEGRGGQWRLRPDPGPGDGHRGHDGAGLQRPS